MSGRDSRAPLPEGKKYHVFLSYAAEDAANAALRLKRLLDRHLEVFLAVESLEPGDLWDAEIPKALAASLLTVVLISKETQASFFQREEVIAAIEQSRDSVHRVVPVYLRGSSASAIFGLLRVHSIYLSKELTLDRVARRLRALVGSIMNQEPPDTSTAAMATWLRKAVLFSAGACLALLCLSGRLSGPYRYNWICRQCDIEVHRSDGLTNLTVSPSASPSLASFTISNSDYFQPDDEPKELESFKVSPSWSPTGTQKVLTSVVEEVDRLNREFSSARAAAYLEEIVKARRFDTDADVDLGVIHDVASMIIRSPVGGLSKAKSQLYPVFDVVISSPEKQVVLKSIEVRLTAVLDFGGDAGEVPTGRLIPIADTIVIRPPVARGEIRRAKPLRKMVAINQMVIPRGGVLRFQVVMDMSETGPGISVVGLRFFLSDGSFVDTGEFALTIVGA